MPGVPPNAFGLLKKVGRSLFGRNKKKSKKATEEPTTATGEPSTEATPPDLETAPAAAPLVVASPTVESAPTLAITDVSNQERITSPAPVPDPTEIAKELPALAVPITETPAPMDVPSIEALTAVEVVKPEATPAPNAAIEAI